MLMGSASRNGLAEIPLPAANATIIGTVLAALLAGCGGSAPAAPARPSSTRPGAAVPAPPSAARTVSFPQQVTGYYLANPSVTGPGTKPSPDPGFARGFPDAATAETGPYIQKGNPSESGALAVTAGQPKQGVNPGSAIQVRYAALDHEVARQSGLPHGTADLTAEPPGSLGGQASCWVTFPFGDNPSFSFCMWADAGTYGSLTGEVPMSELAHLLATFRVAMEH